MSNYQAVATVTATLRRELQNLLATLNPPANATVQVTRPGSAAAGAGLHLYLYRITQHPAFTNADLPTRGFDGRLSEVPSAPLVLHYLLTFFGDDVQFDGQLILGAVAAHLRARPNLTRAAVADTIADAAYSPFVGDSDLDEAPELVKLTPTPLTIDELSQIWAMLPSDSFRPSLAYEASVVFVAADEPTPPPPLPVTRRDVRVWAEAGPVIADVGARAERQAVERGTEVRIRGRGFSSDGLRVALDGTTLAGSAIQVVTATEIHFVVPTATPAGRRSLQVAHDLATSAAGATLAAVSNLVWLLVRPRVVSAAPPAAATPASVTIDLAPAAGQAIEVFLSGGGTGAVLPATPDPTTPGRLHIDVADVDPGTYLVRVRIDGADSVPDLGGTPVTLTVT